MELENTPEIAVLSELLKISLRDLVRRRILNRAKEQNTIDWGEALLASWEREMPSTTPSSGGRASVFEGGTPQEVRMMVLLEEAKRFRTPILYADVSNTSANRIRRGVAGDGHVWSGCKIQTESIGGKRQNVYLDATPLLDL